MTGPDQVLDLAERSLAGRSSVSGKEFDGRNVRIAIFDTWPMEPRPVDFQPGREAHNPFSHIRRFTNRLARRRVDVRRLQQIQQQIAPEHILDYLQGEMDGLPCRRHRCDGSIEPPYRIPDHGLFVAGIIAEMAPEADIWIYRVLNDWGAGELAMVAAAVQHAIDQAERDGVALVINLSLGFAPELLKVPELLAKPERVYLQSQEFTYELSQSASPPGERPLQREAEIRDTEPSLEVLNHLFDVRGLERVLVVAAAGNDSCRQHRKMVGPRMPAAVEGVLGVSAVGRRGAPASYSNEDDILQPDDGIGAFGGEVDPVHGSVSRTTYGVVGLYTADELPPGTPGGNRLGLARWAGTSFAAPIVSGFAACLWSALPNELPAGIMDAIVFEPGPHPRIPRTFLPVFQ